MEPQNLRMSKQFFELLKKLTMVSKSKETVLFKGPEGKAHIVVPTTGTFLHVSGGPADIYFDGNEICIASLMEFIKFCELVGYPEGGSVSVLDETLSNGHVYPMLKFMNGTEQTATRTARTICADPTRFEKKDRQIPQARTDDKMVLLSTSILDQNELKTICNEMKLMPGCQFVSVVVTKSKVRIYMKGRTGQQITSDIPPMNTKLGKVDDINAAYNGSDHTKYRKFPAMYFNVLKGIDTDYELEIRHTGAGSARNKVVLKAFANIPGADPNDPISLYAAGIETDGANVNAEALVE